MNEKKLSDVTAEDVAKYIRLDEVTEDDEKLLNDLIVIAKEFIKNYTGVKEKNLDNYNDFVIVLYILCQDMYDNRVLYVDKSNVNKVVESILGMHSINLL